MSLQSWQPEDCWYDVECTVSRQQLTICCRPVHTITTCTWPQAGSPSCQRAIRGRSLGQSMKTYVQNAATKVSGHTSRVCQRHGCQCPRHLYKQCTAMGHREEQLPVHKLIQQNPHACLLFLSVCASSPYKSAATAPLHQLPGSCIARSRAPAHQQGLCCRGSDCQALAVSPFPKHACLSAHAAAAAAQGHCVNWKTLPTISRPVGICSKQQQQRQQSEPVKLQLQQPTLCSTASLSTCTRKSLCDLASASILMRASSITVGASSITWGEHTAGQLPACIHRSD